MISPSGNFYGSEQVLLDYLALSRHIWTVDIPEKSVFFREANTIAKKHHLREYNPRQIKSYYAGLFLQLFCNKFSVVCINEAGHVKYVILLARIFKSIRFFIHVRLSEDAAPERWPANGVPGNITVVAISDFIRNKLPVASTLIYDLYRFSELPPPHSNKLPEVLKVGIIGRLTLSKGISKLPEVLQSLNRRDAKASIEFHLFGEESEDFPFHLKKELLQCNRVHFRGLVSDKRAMYNDIDAVLHLNEQEPLGRIFLEALDFEVPFTGFNTGGIGEIGQLTGATRFLVGDNSDSISAIADQLLQINANYTEACKHMKAARERALILFSGEKYVTDFEKAVFK